MSTLSKNPSRNETDQDADEILDDAPLEQLYARNWTHDAEDYEEYRPGGFHPVHIGDRFGTAGQFRVIHKLGRGGLATVWLCRDEKAQRYVALKIILADESRGDSPELALVKRKLNYGETGGEFIAVPHEHFWHHGPNGRHLCLVLPVLGPRVTAVWNSGICAVFALEDQVRVSRNVALQVTLGLQFLHKNEICHGDFRPSNILFRLKGFDELSEDELIKQFGEPKKEPLVTISGKNPAPSGPEYLVEGLSLDRIDSRFISDQISIIDFGESYDIHSSPAELGIAGSFRSPELLFDNAIGIGCDLWALACTIYEIRTGVSLFENFMDDDDEVIMEMVPLLGKLPEPWWSSWEARGQWFEEDGTPLLNPNTGQPIMLMGTLEDFLSGKSLSDDNPMRSRKGGYILPLEESKDLANVLRGLLKYEPKERLTVEAALNYPWFKKMG
ncbi:hypothetical protein HYFRA_00008845 [Hymenoscyphus fraxineus]|uniref:EKC/KEOPS complex subunit BUD32 n=1 Tax=Hymenoscyphus fraxineus TaxID=746836 RepID=A0A9N9KYU0_9HELO|nr:hypothetical protein HYFRA_00008845 [Hymenoscyphus fraxineus]